MLPEAPGSPNPSPGGRSSVNPLLASSHALQGKPYRRDHWDTWRLKSDGEQTDVLGSDRTMW